MVCYERILNIYSKYKNKSNIHLREFTSIPHKKIHQDMQLVCILVMENMQSEMKGFLLCPEPIHVPIVGCGDLQGMIKNVDTILLVFDVFLNMLFVDVFG